MPAGGAVLGSAGRPAAAEPPGWVGGAFRTATGDSVTVYVSSTYTPEQVVPQQWAEFFAGIPHGSELGSVVVRIAPPDEVAALCGGDALGCYDARELVMPGSPYDGVAPEHVARHEYGHHIAAHRSNPPWRAADWGPKRWATASPGPDTMAKPSRAAEVEVLIREIQRYLVFIEALRGKDTTGGPPHGKRK